MICKVPELTKKDSLYYNLINTIEVSFNSVFNAINRLKTVIDPILEKREEQNPSLDSLKSDDIPDLCNFLNDVNHRLNIIEDLIMNITNNNAFTSK